MWWLLLCLAEYVSADLRNVIIVQSFNLRTNSKINITCADIKKILIEDVPVTNYDCVGTIADVSDRGMWIITEIQPVSLKDKKLKWLIECSSGNLTSSFIVDNTLNTPLTTSSNITINTSAQEFRGQRNMAVDSMNDSTSVTEQSDVGDQHEADSSVTSKSTTSAATTATTAAMATSATTVVTMTTPTAATTTKAQTPTPTSAVMTITIGYMQFQMGQAPVYVNRNTQAVTVAVIEGLLLGTILAVVLFKFYKKSKLITAGQYPSNDIFQPNYTDNSVYNDNGVLGNGNGRESSARPQIPSYRTQVTQPAVRLDSLQPPPQQEIITPTLMPISTTSTTVTPAPLNNWPDQEKQRHPVKNIMDSDF